jgi:propionyl-CoA carboxylase beta chain
MAWEDELRRLDEDREAFRDFDEARPLGNDRLSPRQRVDVLLDSGTFLEIGARARGRGPSDGAGRGADGAVPGDGIVAGFGTVAGRAAGVLSEDPLALASTDGEVGKNKVLRVLAHAYQGKLPVVYLADGPATPSRALAPAEGGLLGRYSDRQLVVPDLHLESRESPLVVVALGRLRAESRLLAATADLVVERRDAPPARLASVDEEIADLGVGSDEEAVAVVLRFLSLLPESPDSPLRRSAESAAWGPARRLRDDVDPAALTCRELLAAVFDQHSLLAFDAAGDPTLVIGLARLGGYPAVFAIGSSDSAGLGESRLRRMSRIARIAARFRLPIVLLQHGAAYSRDAIEAPRAIERLAELVTLLHDADVPKLCLVSARGHVLGDFVLGGRELGTHYIAAWPQSRIGVDDIASFTTEVAATEAADGPWQAAGLGLLDDVILPSETASRLAAMLRLLAPSRALPPAHLGSERRIPFR